ncbi:hypothetical protein TVAG_317080 [Trichomonas vaginalis G3]|uniref:Uncharacterized protein n=1 Tax=Trichomonas vaginalis (strain ATCC PRA-98 / G3) TaxID=412133 RepID=A2F084_TRIV3|nr:hypothetical protein TVAGG3_0985770 [Trichomonas vaginalis G3]EAY01719.1 hypothetical protein TVAG_317080 [Trichomonas vaginalis G3]KAI5489651.1 hypothetical protein TVAGG3_0985770 [Trichomonas vaginalis G3]|eukprot:XP_001330415.1 hypothetical protein [Trichomonas vaginalis G3]
MSDNETMRLKSDLENKNLKLGDIWADYNRDFDSVELFYKRLLEIQNQVTQDIIPTQANSVETDIQNMLERCDTSISNLEKSSDKLKTNSNDEHYKSFINQVTKLRLLIRNYEHLQIINAALPILNLGTIEEKDKDKIKSVVRILPKLDSGFAQSLFDKVRLAFSVEGNKKIFNDEELKEINEVINANKK